MTANSTNQVEAAQVRKGIRRPAQRTRIQRRHKMLIWSFLLIVQLPVSLIALYLGGLATPQFSSSMSFSVRSEEFANPFDALSGLGELSSGTTSDAQIVFDFIRSQKIVRTLEEEIGLRAVYAAPEHDPVFTIADNVSVEELVQHWNRMVQVNLDKGSGIVRVQAFAFDPEGARHINERILLQSQSLVDQLSFLARQDAIRYAEADLESARERLKTARQGLSEFRSAARVIDPTIAVQSQGGISAALQQQLANAWIELDLLTAATTREDSPRLAQLRRRVSAIESRLEEERQALSGNANSGMVEIVGRFEALLVEREFAEQAFVAAAAAFDVARAEAGRRTKYLAVHIEPTLPDTALYPRSLMIILVSFALLLLGWAVTIMVAYSIRDRG
ncbi:sugar transporter [Halocynthiibacter styelae]|uniref:Sugar transporter n=1 Tax=Halocynthiibacter styelae TaxID=2761955 RepID=A0A8J7IFK6_9RHOB|nr:sugar transporter [Paenihalocynthiibacter styelae]MBI1495117.1 sugar transporter [Paenihalocynthiibacter styelae]